MKRINNIYQRIISIDNLRIADDHARNGKTDRYGVRLHDTNRDANIEALHRTLAAGDYHTSDYSIFTIYKPKRRVIYRLPYYPDRIVHHAVMNILEAEWTKIFIADTFCCLKDRGIHKCMRRVRKALQDRDNTRYCLKLDIRQFYPSIDHDALKDILRRKIKCKATLRLLDGIIDSADGVPIGNYLSQFFYNLYLAYFDHWVKEELKVKHYYRYADDMILLAATKQELHEYFRKIRSYLTERLKLEVKSNYQVFPVAKNRADKSGRGIDFVGYAFYHEQQLLRKSIKHNLMRKVAKLIRNPSLDAKQFKTGIAPWLGWCKHSNSRNLIKQIYKNYEESKI